MGCKIKIFSHTTENSLEKELQCYLIGMKLNDYLKTFLQIIKTTIFSEVSFVIII